MVAILSGITLFSGTAFSGRTDSITGWAWGEAFNDMNNNGIQDEGENDNGGIGWISLNNINCDPDDDGQYGPLNPLYPECPTSGPSTRYGVTINPDGYLVGYGWSEHLGWIRFGLGSGGGFPGGSGTHYGEARINTNGTPSNLDDDFMEGWARACSVFLVNCDGALAPITTRGGWDGWISLKGSTSNSEPYGVTYNATQRKFEGFPWGGNGTNNSVIGWLWFEHAMRNDPDAPAAVCGTAHGQDFPSSPPANQLCSVGTGSTVTPSGSSYTWTCTSQVGTNITTTQCSANLGGCDDDTDCRVSGEVCNRTTNACIRPQCRTNNDCQAGERCYLSEYRCIRDITPLTVGTYQLNPRIVATPDDFCNLYNWQVSGGEGDINCRIDGGPNIPYTGANAQGISVGTHTLICTDSIGQTARFSPDPQCRVNPNYGEF